MLTGHAEPAGVRTNRSGVLEAEADLQRDLEVVDLTVADVPADLARPRTSRCA